MNKTPPEAFARVREMVANMPGVEEDGVDGMTAQTVEAVRHFAQLLVGLMEHNKGLAPNYWTIDIEGDSYAYELTFRRAEGMAPAAKIAAQEAEIRRLRRRLATAQAGATPPSEASTA